MPELLSPLWLLALVPLVPLLRWLHRFREHGTRIDVSALFLWRGLPGTFQHGARRDTPDPLWIRRALFAGLLLALVSQPVWYQSKPTLTVWFDHSLSMRSQEPEEARWEQAVQQLFAALEQKVGQRVELRSLNVPGEGIPLRPDAITAARESISSWLSSPYREGELPLLPLQPGEHWLVSDGASEGLQGWVTAAGITKVIQAGIRVDNQALTQLSVRRGLLDPSHADILIEAANLGQQSVTRRVELLIDAHSHRNWELSIPPGKTVTRQYTTRLSGQSVLEARLLAPANAPPDPLPQDDRLLLRLADSGWQVPISVDGICPPAIHRVVAGIPALDILSPLPGSATPRARISCSGEADNAVVPLIKLHQPAVPTTLSGAAVWQPGAGQLQRLALPSAVFRGAPGPIGPPDEAILTLGETTLISRRQAPPGYDLWFDLHYSPLIRRPEFPVLITGIIESAVGVPLLDGTLSVQHDSRASRITPVNLQATSGVPSPWRVSQAVDLSGWLILPAIAFLLWELWHYRIHRRGMGNRTVSGGIP